MKKRPGKYLNFFVKSGQGGFGLIESVTAMALLGVILVGVISQERLSTKGSLDVASETEVNNIMKKVTVELGLPDNCAENFANTNPDGVSHSLLKRKNTPANNILTLGEVKNDNVGNAAIVEVTDIVTTKKSANEMLVTLSFRKRTSSLTEKFMSRKIKREFVLNTVMKPAPDDNQVAACYGSYDLLVKTAIELSCKGRGAWFIETNSPPYGECHHINQDEVCGPGQYLKEVKVDETAGKVSGPLRYVCGTLNTTPCSGGNFITGFKSDGTYECGPAFEGCPAGHVIVKNNSGQLVCTEINCPSTHAFAGFNTDGSARCESRPNLGSCGIGNFATTVNPDGSKTCNAAPIFYRNCPSYQRVVGVDSTGNPVCASFVTTPYSCPAGQAIDGVDSAGNPTCKVYSKPLLCNGSQTAHSYKDCEAIPGAWVAFRNSTRSQCRIPGPSCPGGWTRCDLNGEQATAACTDTSNTYYCDGNRATRYAVPANGGVFENYGQNSTTCVHWSGYPNTGHACYVSYPYGPTYTTQTSVGCY